MDGLKIEIASPCSNRWEDMVGSERVRQCEDCRLNVYNIADLTSEEARALLASGGRTCVRIFRRTDGTVLTRDCPFELRRAVGWLARRAVLGATVVVGLALGLFGLLVGPLGVETRSLERAAERMLIYLKLRPEPVIMGEVCPPPPPPGAGGAAGG